MERGEWVNLSLKRDDFFYQKKKKKSFGNFENVTRIFVKTPLILYPLIYNQFCQTNPEVPHIHSLKPRFLPNCNKSSLPNLTY